MLSRRGRTWAAAGCWAAARARAGAVGPGRSSGPPPARGRPVPRSPPARAAAASPAPAASSSAPSPAPSAAALLASSSYPSGATQRPLPGRRSLSLLPCRCVAVVEAGRGKWRTWWRWVGEAGGVVGWTVGEGERATSISEASCMEARERSSMRHLCEGDGIAGTSQGRSCRLRAASPVSRRAPAGSRRLRPSSGTRSFREIDPAERFP